MSHRVSILYLALACTTAFCSGAVLAGSVALPGTGQTTAYAPGDDGSLQAGVAWPTPRFTDNGDGTITDELTGLIWLKDANCLGGGQFWNTALTSVDLLNTTGVFACTDYVLKTYSDWRVPNLNELESLVNAAEPNIALWLNGQGFVDFDWNRYWSSTALSLDPGAHWFVDMWFGHVQVNGGGVADVLAVRGGSTDGTPDTRHRANTWNTGQTVSYDVGDDGNLRTGVSWPSPRLSDNGDGTTTDNLTGLIWLNDINCLGMPDWYGALSAANTLASGKCDLLDGSVSGDWRLPNRKELHSRTDFSQSPSTCSTFGAPAGFWSSTTMPSGDAFAYFVRFSGCIGTQAKTDPNILLVWPVRGARTLNPIPDIKANGSDGPVTITRAENLSVTAALTAGDLAGSNADWWILADTAFGWHYFDVVSKSWIPGQSVSYQGPLRDLTSYPLLSRNGLPAGTYVLHVEVDLTMNGIRESGFSDSVQVDITP